VTRALQKLIHAGCRALKIDTETRHLIQIAATGKASLSEMTEADLRRVVEALKAKGFDPAAGLAKARRHPPAPRADLRYVHRLWSLLGQAGALQRPGRAGLNAFVRARFEAHWGAAPADIDMLRDAGAIRDVIDALRAMCRRAGIEPEPERAP